MLCVNNKKLGVLFLSNSPTFHRDIHHTYTYVPIQNIYNNYKNKSTNN